MKKLFLSFLTLSITACLSEKNGSFPASAPTPPSSVTQSTFTVTGATIIWAGAPVNPQAVPQEATIQVNFSNDIDPKTAVVNGTAQFTSVLVSYDDTSGETAFQPGVVLKIEGKQMTLSAPNKFYGGSLFTLTINSTLQDLPQAGKNAEPLNKAYQLTFKTTGNPPGSKISVGFDYDFGPKAGQSKVDSFVFLYGNNSGNYDISGTAGVPVTNVHPMDLKAEVGKQHLSGEYDAAYQSGHRYYLTVKACRSDKKLCGKPAPETFVDVK